MKILICIISFVLISRLEAKYRYYPKHWLSTCNAINCKTSLDSCLNCYGERQCKSCISTTPGCSSCADDIFNKNDLEDLGGNQYLICDSSDQFQSKVCHIFCRGQFQQSGSCLKYQNMPVCECSSSAITPTSTHLPTTIAPVLSFNGLIKTKIDVLDGFQRIHPLPNGNLIRGSAGPNIQIWDTTRGTVIRTLSSAYLNPFVFGVLSNGEIIAGYNGNKTLLVWDLSITDDEPLKRIIATTESFQCMTVLDNNDLAIGQFGPNYDIVIKDSFTGHNKKRLIGHTGTVNQILIISNGNIASCSIDKTVRIWDPLSGTLLRTLIHSTPVQSITILKNGNLVLGVSEGLIKVWNIDTGTITRIIRGHTSPICNFGCLFVLNNNDLISGSFDKTIRLWNPFDGSQITIANSHKTDVRQLSFSNVGTLISTSNSEILIWS